MDLNETGGVAGKLDENCAFKLNFDSNFVPRFTIEYINPDRLEHSRGEGEGGEKHTSMCIHGKTHFPLFSIEREAG